MHGHVCRRNLLFLCDAIFFDVVVLVLARATSVVPPPSFIAFVKEIDDDCNEDDFAQDQSTKNKVCVLHACHLAIAFLSKATLHYSGACF